ncbi:alpha-amylase family glycosyl hydrolase [Streptococcus ovis]|uniref:alpha-amylase family glycosyl hydrolase n=1 Tax=Streptococcus ovis TaxID=82806 RepID=UPI00039FB4A1
MATLEGRGFSIATIRDYESRLPPAFKATGVSDVGYGVYDLFDLGEFDQNGTIRTKYGTKDDYLAAIQALKTAGIMPIADIVLNHKANGDHKERFSVLKMNPANRQEPISEPYEIEGWTGFQFPGRAGVYNDFQWHWYHFTGVDYDASHNETGIYLILGDNKGWAEGT